MRATSMSTENVHLDTSSLATHRGQQQARSRIQISSIPLPGRSSQAATLAAVGDSAAGTRFDPPDNVIAFSSGSTPALTAAERQKGALCQDEHFQSAEGQQRSPSAPSPLRDFLKRRQTAGHTAPGIPPAAADKSHTEATAGKPGGNGDPASLTVPSTDRSSDTTSHRQSLDIASKNEVHRPRARTRILSSRDRAEGDCSAAPAAARTSRRRTEEQDYTLASAFASMSSPQFGGVASGSSSNAMRGTVNARDYGHPSSKQHHHHNNSNSNSATSDFSSPPQSASTGGSGSVILSSPFSPTNNGIARPAGGGTPSIRTGNSSKASQMLGLSTAHHRSPDVYMSQTATYHSGHSDSASTVNGNNRYKYAQQQHSPTASIGSGGKDSSSPHQQSHTRMTLKKARSLFTSGGGKSNKDKNAATASSPEPGLPSPQYGLPRPMGMGSYGDLGYHSPPSATGSYPAPSMLSHSKSHGSLQGAMYGSTRPSNPPPLPSVPGSGSGSNEPLYHPYAAGMSARKASHPNLPSHTSRSASTPTQREIEQETNCPVCLESLSIRLQGEKPHVIPVCGHKLHNDCFETAYNTTVKEAIGESDDRTEGQLRRKKRQPIGICGICRSEMVIGDPSELGKNKFAMLSGQPDRSGPPALDMHGIYSISRSGMDNNDNDMGPKSASLHHPSEDQDIVNPHQLLPAYMQHLALGPARSSPFARVDRVEPKISVRAEHTSLARVNDPEKRVHLTCLVTVEIPSRVPGLDSRVSQSQLPVSASQKSLPQVHSVPKSHSGHQLGTPSSSRDRSISNSGTSITASSSGNQLPCSEQQAGSVYRRESNATAHTHGTEDFPTSPSVSTFSGGHAPPASSSGMERNLSSMTTSSSGHHLSQTPATTASAGFTPQCTSASSFDEGSNDVHRSSGSSQNQSGYNLAMNASTITLTSSHKQAAEEEKTREAHGPFADIFNDLKERMSDWKGHEPATFGSLRTYDLLAVKKDKNVREFVVYLFEEALLCVVDDGRKNSTPATSTSTVATVAGTEGKLRLKGRVFVKHMKQVEDTSSMDDGLSLTIHMEDDSLESFVILFPHREVLEVWRSQIQALIDHHRPPIPSSTTKSSLATSGSRRDSVFSNETSRSAQSSFSRNTKATSVSHAGSGPVPSGAIPPVPSLNKSMASPASALLDWTPPDPATFVPIDLMLVLSVPRANASSGPSSNGLKLRLIRSTLDFIIHSVGPRARISIVAYSTGDSSSSVVRKTPWLATGRSDGIRRLEQAVAELAGESAGRREDGLVLVDPKEEKVTVATAVNLALDIMLQRTSKSATSGMIVLNDGKDGAQRQQIDLVLARTDAGGVPIHTFGWGKSHDPSSLWLLSNHTRGTYTFVQDFYQLKEAMAGCIGGMLCVAVHSLRLHLNVQERRWFKIRKVAGVASAIVSTDGKDVDLSLGEMRFGEKKEMLVEIEMASPRRDNSGRPVSSHARSQSKDKALSRKKTMTATDNFFLKKVGMDPQSLGDDDAGSTDFYEEVEEGMADDVPVFDISASFKNPQDPVGEVCRLPYPTLLTITVTPPPTNNDKAPDSPTSTSMAGTISDPTIVRRRMELLTSDMITRTLLLMSRRQDAGAQRLLMETTRIFSAIIANLIPPSMHENNISNETRYANDVLQACLEDIEQLKTGCNDRAEFDTVTRNFGAQQAVALRDQRAWTARTATEALFFSREWTGIFGRSLSNAI